MLEGGRGRGGEGKRLTIFVKPSSLLAIFFALLALLLLGSRVIYLSSLYMPGLCDVWLDLSAREEEGKRERCVWDFVFAGPWVTELRAVVAFLVTAR